MSRQQYNSPYMDPNNDTREIEFSAGFEMFTNQHNHNQGRYQQLLDTHSVYANSRLMSVPSQPAGGSVGLSGHPPRSFGVPPLEPTKSSWSGESLVGTTNRSHNPAQDLRTFFPSSQFDVHAQAPLYQPYQADMGAMRYGPTVMPNARDTQGPLVQDWRAINTQNGFTGRHNSEWFGQVNVPSNQIPENLVSSLAQALPLNNNYTNDPNLFYQQSGLEDYRKAVFGRVCFMVKGCNATHLTPWASQEFSNYSRRLDLTCIDPARGLFHNFAVGEEGKSKTSDKPKMDISQRMISSSDKEYTQRFKDIPVGRWRWDLTVVLNDDEVTHKLLGRPVQSGNMISCSTLKMNSKQKGVETYKLLYQHWAAENHPETEAHGVVGLPERRSVYRSTPIPCTCTVYGRNDHRGVARSVKGVPAEFSLSFIAS